jgi:hypothetical protein
LFEVITVSVPFLFFFPELKRYEEMALFEPEFSRAPPRVY